MADREFDNPRAHNLPGFSSNAHWAEVQEGGAWSHTPSSEGPKDGFHDPVEADPVRQELWNDANQTGAPDDALRNGRF